MAGFFEISFSLLKDQGIFAEHSDAGVTFRDKSETMRLFDSKAVNDLVATFGEHRTDMMLDQAAAIVQTEIFGEKLKKAMIR